jgi:hypothetical protein
MTSEGLGEMFKANIAVLSTYDTLWPKMTLASGEKGEPRSDFNMLNRFKHILE